MNFQAKALRSPSGFWKRVQHLLILELLADTWTNSRSSVYPLWCLSQRASGNSVVTLETRYWTKLAKQRKKLSRIKTCVYIYIKVHTYPIYRGHIWSCIYQGSNQYKHIRIYQGHSSAMLHWWSSMYDPSSFWLGMAAWLSCPCLKLRPTGGELVQPLPRQGNNSPFWDVDLSNTKQTHGYSIFRTSTILAFLFACVLVATWDLRHQSQMSWRLQRTVDHSGEAVKAYSLRVWSLNMEWGNKSWLEGNEVIHIIIFLLNGQSASWHRRAPLLPKLSLLGYFIF